MLNFPTATSGLNVDWHSTQTADAVHCEQSFLMPTKKHKNSNLDSLPSPITVVETPEIEEKELTKIPLSDPTEEEGTEPQQPDSPIQHTGNVGNLIIKPKELGFIPPERWENVPTIEFSSLQAVYFPKRSSKKLRFEQKLWNALLLTQRYPVLKPVIGVEWSTNNIIKVDVNTLAKLLGISKATSALCSPQGSFPSHGFVEIVKQDAPQSMINSSENVRYYQHESGCFRSDSSQEDLEKCKWTSKNKHSNFY